MKTDKQINILNQGQHYDISRYPSKAGITATLSGGAAVAIYSDNKYESHDLDFVTAAIIVAGLNS